MTPNSYNSFHPIKSMNKVRKVIVCESYVFVYIIDEINIKIENNEGFLVSCFSFFILYF